MQNRETISAEKLEEVIATNSGLILVDVRSPGEYNAVHIANSINLPLGGDGLLSFGDDQSLDKNQQLILICQSGARAAQACEKIGNSGFKNVKILDGGVGAWSQRGYSVVKGEGAISMERQVRIAAGLIVLISSMLVLLGLKSFVFLPIFVGAGLVFSGVTNTCGMARVLALMPWNNVSSDSCCSGEKSCQK